MPESIKMRDLVLCIIASGSGDKDLGRTTLQKIAYLYGVTHDVDLGHRPYYYGPFSAAVERDVEALSLAGLIAEDARTLGFLNATGRPATAYRYSVTEEGKRRLENVAQVHPQEVEQVQRFVELLLGTFGTLNQNDLSIAAKTLYIASEQGQAVSFGQVQELAAQYGWELSTPQIQKVVKMLSDLRLVRTQP
jgi:uncharacterized protein YwgA